jgi:hypothetical protein
MIHSNILCSISTKGRYFTTLPLAISSVITQTQLPKRLVIFDDNDDPQDMRKENVYTNLFQIMDIKGIEWEWLWAGKQGQHHNHQRANQMPFEWIWRVDDDTIPEPTVLENLAKHCAPGVGAIGGTVCTPGWKLEPVTVTGKMANIYNEPNIQWFPIKQVQEVDHLHCSFLYRAGVADYNLGLSRVAHREETLFTWELTQRGFKNLVVPGAMTWHLKSPSGGIRDLNVAELFDHDEKIFQNIIGLKDQTIVVLNNGMGDHIMFKSVLKDIKNPTVFSCYPEIIPGRSIQEAKDLFGDIEQWNIYRKMDQWRWTQSVEQAFRKLYGV